MTDSTRLDPIAAAQASYAATKASASPEERAYYEALDALNAPAPRPATPTPTPAPVTASTPVPAIPVQPLPGMMPAPRPATLIVDRSAEIDNVINVLRDNGADLSSPVRSGHAGMIYNSATDTFTQTSEAPAAGTDARPMYDDGSRDLQAEADALVANHDALVARLNAGRYDPVTGQRVYEVQGRDREILELQVAQAKESGRYGIDQLNRVAAQRATQTGRSVAPLIQMADGTSLTLEEAAAREAFIATAGPGQRQQFAADYDRAMRQARASAVTGAIIAAKIAGRR